MSMNMVILTGRLTAEPEMKYTQAGKAYVKFGLAVNRRSKEKDETDFINIIAWEKKAELVSQYLHKGSLIGVTGSLRIRAYEDENGVKKKSAEVLMDTLEFLEKRAEGSFDRSGFDTGNASASTSVNTNTHSAAEDDFPF